MSDYKRLKAAYPDDEIVKVISLSDSGQQVISPKMAWVYSALLWRFPRPATKAEISRWTGIHQGRSSILLGKMIQIGLVAEVIEKKAKKYRPIKPLSELSTIDYFRWWKCQNGKHELSYHWAIYRPGRDIIDGLVEAADYLRQRSAATLSRFLGVDRRTISAARQRVTKEKEHEDGIERGIESAYHETTTTDPESTVITHGELASSYAKDDASKQSTTAEWLRKGQQAYFASDIIRANGILDDATKHHVVRLVSAYMEQGIPRAEIWNRIPTEIKEQK